MNDKDLQSNISANELAEAGVEVRASRDPALRKADRLERYRLVPNHAMFLYTSEDSLLDNYIRQHWAALDGLTGDICDIHVSLMQLHGEEDAYSQFEDIKSLPGLDSIDPTDLPALHIWSRHASLRILLGPFQNETALKEIFRLVFSELRKNAGPLLGPQVEELSQKTKNCLASLAATNQQIAHAQVGRDVVQVTINNFGKTGT